MPQLSQTQREFNYTNRETHTEEVGVDELVEQKAAVLNLQKLLSTTSNETEAKAIQAQLDKIQSLKLVIIPTKEGNKRYYSMVDAVKGVTEKTCLIDEETLKNNLKELVKAKDYHAVMQNKIRMNAILKHPKAGKDIEVQREAIALKIARILGFEHVTNSTLVNHDTGKGRHPCLFVPFDKMTEMSDFIENANSSHGRLKQMHFQSVEDFGRYSAFFMLCSDPDFIGKAGQNKGLAGGEPKRLYIFDQVFMTANNFGLDRAFNLVPTNALSKLPNAIARHFMGRNKSVINDSSFEEKIQGAINLLQKKAEIKSMLEEVATANSNQSQDPLVKQLQDDAKSCLKNFHTRMRTLEKLFPSIKIDGKSKQVSDLVKTQDEDNLKIVKKSMLLTQLINKPLLYDKSGKPYRAPFFTQASTRVNQVSIHGDEVCVSFVRKFGPALSENKKALLKQQGFTISKDGKSATISRQALLELNEQEYFKEQKNSIDPQHNYLDPKRIKVIAKTYNESADKLLKLIDNLPKTNQASALEAALKELDNLPFKNKGFAAHVQQCILYEAMKVIMNLNPDKKLQLEIGFQDAKREGKLKEYVESGLKQCIALVEKKASSEYRSTLHSWQQQPLPKTGQDELLTDKTTMNDPK